MRNLCLTITSKRKLILLACATAALPASAAPSLQAQLQTIQAQMVQMQANMQQLTTQNQALISTTQALKSQVAPVGSVMAFAQGTVPDGWLECDGRTLDKDDDSGKYLNLFNAIRHTYSPEIENNDSHFNLPDLRGEFLRGWSHERQGVDTARELGSAQIGTNVLVDDDHLHNMGAIDIESNDLSWLGYEPASRNSITHHFNKANYNTTTTGTLLRTIRPRNVAMIYAIKY